MDRRQTDRRNEKYGDIYVLDVQALAGILWRRRVLAVIFALLVLVPGILYALFRPAEYKATAAVFIGDEQPNPGEEEQNQPERFDELNMDTQERVLTSINLAERTVSALESEGIAPDGTRIDPKPRRQQAPAQDLNANDSGSPENVVSGASPDEKKQRLVELRGFMSRLAVQPQPRSRVITITYVSNDAFLATEIANTHIDEYLAYLIEIRRAQTEEQNAWIAEQIETLKVELRTKSQAVQDFRKEAGIVLGTNSEDLIYQQISDISQQLIPLETQKASLQAREAALQSSPQGNAIADITNSSLVQSFKSQASTADVDLKGLTANLGPNHPDVLAAKKRAAQARQDIAKETGTIRSTVAAELKAVTEQEVLLRTRLDELNKQAEELREKEITLASLVSEETASRTLLENFMQRYELGRTEAGLNQSNVQVFARAEIPTAPIGVSKTLFMIVVTFVAVIFAVGMVLLLELVDRGLETSDDVKRLLNVRLAGTLPKVRSPLTAVQGKNGSAYLEELKRVYLALASKPSGQAIMFTESRHGEGKATTLLALARYLHSVGTKVVVLDTDHAAPSTCADKAGLPDAPGLAEYLSGQADMARIVQRDDFGLPLIGTGNAAAHPYDILGSEQLRNLIASLKAQYGFVFVNSAPALATTDAEILAGLSDQTVLVVERARVPKKHLKKVADMLRQYSRDVPVAILTKYS